MWTSCRSPVSRSQLFSSSGTAVMLRPARVTGIPSRADRWTVDSGKPINSALRFQPRKSSAGFGLCAFVAWVEMVERVASFLYIDILPTIPVHCGPSARHNGTWAFLTRRIGTEISIMKSHVHHEAHARQFARPNRERLPGIRARCVAAVALGLLCWYFAHKPATSRLQCADLHLPMSWPSGSTGNLEVGVSCSDVQSADRKRRSYREGRAAGQ